MSATVLNLSSFPGGLHLDDHKDLVSGEPIAPAPVPPQLVVPLAQHVGAAADAIVKVGQQVRRGEPIGRAHGYISLPIHAPSSGTVVAIEDRPVAHPSGIPARCVVIDTDGADTPAEPDWETIAEPETAEPHALRDIARAAGIAGLGGASFPTFVKLNPSRPVDALIINGAECEPYIACDQALMAEDAEQIIAGARAMMRALDTRQCLVGIEDNKPKAIAAMTAAAAGDERITVVTVPTRYPQGGEKQLIQTLTGREVPSQGLPLDIGIVCQNPGTVRAFHRAVVHGEPMIDRVISLTGNAMAHPRNVRARIGTPLSFLVAHFGGYAVPPGRLVMGGPMMGIGIPDDAEVPVVKSSNCLLAMRPEEVRPDEPAMPCIRCGACTDACPAGLLPQQLYWHARARELDKTQAYNLFDCIECGCCAAVCPSHIPLVQYYRFAKTEIWAEERERIAADAARVRHEERQRRLEREAAEKEAARAARKQKARNTDAAAEASPAPAAEPADDPVARAMAAAKARKAAAAGDTDAAATTAADGDDDPIARAKAAARARKAGKATAKDASVEQPDTASDDPVERAKVAARARKAQQQSAGTEGEPAAPESSEDNGDDPVARAIAAAKAKKAAAKHASAEQPDADAASDDPVERAKAAARARKAQQQSAGTEGEPAAPESSEDNGDDPVARAIAAAKAKKAAAKHASAEQPDADAASDDPVERAKAAARARKAQRAQQANDDTAGNTADASPAADDGDDDGDAVARAIARAKARKAAQRGDPDA